MGSIGNNVLNPVIILAKKKVLNFSNMSCIVYSELNALISISQWIISTTENIVLHIEQQDKIWHDTYWFLINQIWIMPHVAINNDNLN